MALVSLLLHGFISSKDSGTIGAVHDALTARGVKTVTMDFPSPLPDGTLAQALPSDMIVRTIAEIKRCVPSDKIVLVGHSLGGIVALGAAKEVPVAAIVLIAAPARVSGFAERKLEDEQRAVLARDGKVVLGRKDDSRSFTVSQVFFDEMELLDATAFAKKVNCPTLLVYGGGDRAVGVEHAEAILFSLSGPKELVMIGGASHNFVDHRDELVAAVTNFVQKI